MVILGERKKFVSIESNVVLVVEAEAEEEEEEAVAALNWPQGHEEGESPFCFFLFFFYSTTTISPM